MTTDSSERWRQIQGIFQEVLKVAPERRPTFLDERCGGDAEVRAGVDSLLSAVEHSGDGSRPPPETRVKGKERRALLAPGTQVAHYKIASMLGAGGMGEVYLAEDLRLRRKVALKIIGQQVAIDERSRRRFEHEAQAASALNHPNILTVYEFGQFNGLHFIASEFVEGITLRHKMLVSKLDLNTAIDISAQIASALAAAHDGGIVHRDVKPDNVIVRSDGIVKVVDFGIAKLGGAFAADTVQASAVTSSISQPGMVLGTAKYMSPEQARGVEIDARSDIFSLGSVMYEMVTGKEAFGGETSSDVIAAILKTEPTPPLESSPDLPYEIERIISKALRKERESRYQSVRDLLIDLQDFKKEFDFQAKLQTGSKPERSTTGSSWRHTEPVAVSSGREISHGKWLLAAAVTLVVAIAAAGIFYQHRSSTRSELARARTLAVLPFQNLKPDPETDFLGFSLADEIITKLGYVKTLTIRPSSSVEKYRNQTIDAKKVAADLNVDTLLTGSFMKDADQLRITTQLIDVSLDKILWQDVLDVKYDKLLTVQDRVSQQIIKELEVNLSPAEAENLSPEKPINSLAYEYYLRGVDLYSLNDFPAAIGMLEKSTEIEPKYAPAWAHLGRAYTTHASLQFGGRDDYKKAQAAYERAIALNPALVEPRIYMANLYTDTGRVEQAVPLLRSVLIDSPNNAEAHWELGYAYRFAGMLDESLAESQQARQINPQVKINSSAMNSYLYLSQYKEFLQSLPVNDSAYILFYRGLGEYYLNEGDEAGRDFDRAYERDASSFPAAIGKSISYSIHHDNTRGLQLLRQTESKMEERGVSDAEGMYKIAQAYAVLGDKISALRLLRKSIDSGFFCYPYLIHDPLLQGLHSEHEYQELMSQALHRHEQFKASFFQRAE
jgi:serine/threonine protein kinase/tetratricopeptide (TPR) repeat protein